MSQEYSLSVDNDDDVISYYDQHDASKYVYNMQKERYKIFKAQDQENGHFDCALEINGKKLYVHKFVLATASETFNALLSDRWNKTKENIIKIDNLEYTYDRFYQFICFLYSGYCKLTQSNICVLIDMAEYYGVQDLKDHCDYCFSYQINITLENVEQIVEFTEKYSLKKSLKRLKSFVTDKFGEIIKAADFIKHGKIFMEFLSSAISHLKRDNTFFEAVCKWADHQATLKKAEVKDDEDFDSEQFTIAMFDGILENIYFTGMNFDFVKKFILTREYLFDSYELYYIIGKSIKSSCDEDECFSILYQIAENEVKAQQKKVILDENFDFKRAVRDELTPFLPHVRFYWLSYKFLMEFVVEKEFEFSLAEVYAFLGRSSNEKREEKRFKEIYEIAKKQILMKQPNIVDFDLDAAIKNQLSEVIPKMDFYEMSPKFLMEFVVAKGVITAKQAEHVHDVCVEIKNDAKTLFGTFKDEYGVYEVLRKVGDIFHFHDDKERDWSSWNKPLTWNKLRLRRDKFKILKSPSTVMKMKGVDWYLCFDKDESLYVKHRTLVDRNDYLVAEMRSKSNEEFMFNTEKEAMISTYYRNLRDI